MGGGILPSNVVHGTCTAGGVYPRRVKAGEKKESKKRATPLSSLLLSSSPVSPGEVPLVARQRIVTGADSTNRRFHSCNVTRGSFCREHVRAYMRAYLISSAPRMSHKCARARDCFACAPRVTRRRGTAERERFRGLVQRLCAS